MDKQQIPLASGTQPLQAGCVLVVDDDESISTTLRRILCSVGYVVLEARDGHRASAIIASGGVDVVLLDLGLPGIDGLEVLAGAQCLGGKGPAIVVVTARDDMASTVRAMQLGAFDYLVKPFDVDRIKAVVARALESRVTTHSTREIAPYSAESVSRRRLYGRTSVMREVYKAIGAVSTSTATVLVRGESGTGKELVAKAIHDASPYSQQPFVAANCSAFATGLLESELFGHARGAFTGAISDKPGRLELAGSGTLMLDEIGEIPFDLQAKLLRVLQERTFERVGDAAPRPFRARVIAATHRDLDALVREGRFRADLLYRLKVVEIRVPALRERRADIPLLVEHLIARIAHDLHKTIRYVSPDALALLEAYGWPGNVRELENVLTCAIVHASGDVLHAGLLALSSRQSYPGADRESVPLALHELECKHITRVLRHTNWNKKQACGILKISRPTLDRKIDEYGLQKMAQ